MHHFIVRRFGEQKADFGGLLAGDLSDVAGGVVGQASGDRLTFGRDDGDDLAAVEFAVDTDDARGEQASVFLRESLAAAVVDDDGAGGADGADPATAAG